MCYLVVSQPRYSVIDRRQDGFKEGKLGVQAEEEQHDEEQDRPHRRDGQAGQGLGVGHECQT